MDKRMIWSAAGAITITVVAASSALAVSMNGTPDRSTGDPGTFNPSATTVATATANNVEPQVITVYVDETTTSMATASMLGSTVPAPPASAAAVPSGSAPAVASSGASGTGSSYDDDDHDGYDDDHDDDDDRYDDDDHEYEGGEDDD